MLVGDGQESEHLLEPLGCSVQFKTYADATLATLYLDNMEDFTIDLFMKVFNVLLDPRFKLEEITFRSIWDIFEHVAADRRQKEPTSMVGRNGPPQMAEAGCTGTTLSTIPLVVVSLVVDKMAEDRFPLGITTAEPICTTGYPRDSSPWDFWEDADDASTKDFNQMCLVHRSWLPIVRKALRRRAVVPYHHANHFLLSPLCGPWITEMALYWTAETEGVDCSQGRSGIECFRGLLKRTPNLQSLSFIVSFDPPSVGRDTAYQYEGTYLQLISTSLPKLENLRLKHTGFSTYIDPNSPSIYRPEYSLSRQISNMRALKTLSIRSWCGSEWEDSDMHPPSCLRTIELDYGLHKPSFSWLLRGRNGYELQNLTIIFNITYLDFDFVQRMRCCLENLLHLRICLLFTTAWNTQDSQTERENAFRICRFIREKSVRLVTLEFFIMKDDFDFSLIRFPSSLRRITLHFHSKTLRQILSAPDSEMSFRFLTWLKEHVTALPNLRTLAITGSEFSSRTAWDWQLHKLAYHLSRGCTTAQEDIPEELAEVCKEDNIELIYWCEPPFVDVYDGWGFPPVTPPAPVVDQNAEETAQL